MPDTKKCSNSACGATNASTAAFCSECGTKLELRCPNPQCGAVLRGGEKFCAKCGTRLRAAPAVPGTVKQEETVLTRTANARIHLFPTDKGGRHAPVFPGYRPNLSPRGSNQELKVEFDGYEMLQPGQSGTVNVRLLDDGPYAFNKGDQFTIVENTSANTRELVELVKMENANADLAVLGLDDGGLHFVGEVEIL